MNSSFSFAKSVKSTELLLSRSNELHSYPRWKDHQLIDFLLFRYTLMRRLQVGGCT